ncbi:MAG TPA: hypothetical protein VFO07_02020 [Roseiflexaceae bacterium]|nr:hypothetical protein [Roseiflexaceae bacterium]
MTRYLQSTVLILVCFALWLVPSAQAAERICFKEVPDCIEGRFAEYWRANGGLEVFGLPLGPARQERVGGGTYLAQLFERNRFELHPENSRPYDVLLGRLGDEQLKRQGRDWKTLLQGQPKSGCQFFETTAHAVCQPFLDYWRTHGLEFDGRQGVSYAESLALFGLPLSEPTMERNSSGDNVLTQWFERTRFEYHPNNPDPYKVLLGRLGAEGRAPAGGAACAGIPASVNATVTPGCFKAGTPVTARASGFKANEQVTYTVKPPAGVDIPAFLLTGAQTADSRGTVELSSSFPEGTPAGLYSVTFRGATSGRSGVIYFKIVE